MNNKKQQILVFFLGLLTILIIVEIGLRITGNCYQKSRETLNQPPAIKGKNNFIILCLGNSFTLGAGALAGESYPDQLQRMFNGRSQVRNVIVINKGVNCENTAELLIKLKNNINNAKPDLIILQTGQPNWWNFYKYSSYLKKTSRNKIFYVLQDFFYKSRVYRLMVLLNDNISIKMKAEKFLGFCHASELEQIDFEKVIRMIRDRDKDFFADQQKVSAAVNLLEKRIEIDPHYSRSYNSIGEVYLYQRNYDEALKWFMKAVMVSPNFRDNYEENRAYKNIRNMRSMAMGSQEKEIKNRIDEFIVEFKKRHPENAENFLALSNESINRWVKSDIIEIVRIIRSKNIKIILQNYPEFSQKFKIYNNTLRQITIQLKIPFIDNEKIFQEIMIEGEKPDDYFVADGHCNSKGYRIMASNVYKKIFEEKLLGTNKQEGLVVNAE